MPMEPELIAKFPMFASLNPAEIQALSETLQEVDVPEGTILMEEGAMTRFVFGIIAGEVEIVKALGTSDERVVAISKQGAILGEMSLFSHTGSHTASVRACTPLKMWKITLAQFDELLHRFPSVTYTVLRTFSARLEDSENLTIKDLREKNLQLTKAYEDLKAAQQALIVKEKLEHELQLASKIQRGVLPEELPSHPGYDFGALMVPARQVGGDFYDFIPLPDHRLGLVVGDVCDKGIPAALFMALSYSSLRIEAFRHKSPGKTLRALNRHLLQVNRSNMFVTLLYGVLDYQTWEFSYARAGHPAPLLFDGSYQPVPVPSGLGQLIGMLEAPVLDEQSISIPPGGTLLIYSDGLSETVEASPSSPLLPQLCSQILSQPDNDAQAFCRCLLRTVGGDGAESLIQDDFTLIAVKRL